MGQHVFTVSVIIEGTTEKCIAIHTATEANLHKILWFHSTTMFFEFYRKVQARKLYLK